MDYTIALAHFPKLTLGRYKKLTAFFPDSAALEQAELTDIMRAGIEPEIADEFIRWRESNPPEKIFAALHTHGITAITINSPEFPPLLKEISDPPITLFIRGNIAALSSDTALSIVGTRRASNYGRQVTAQFASTLARLGVTIVSGLAYGVDAMAHHAALEAEGNTVAILGSGVDDAHIFPSANRQLAKRIIERGGAVASEYPPGFSPTSYSFPMRNRIIAGLTRGTLVVEAPAESGALITARAAIEYNREVLAIPHSITSETGAGNNTLLKQGATPVTDPEEILEILQLHHLITSPASPPTTPALSAEERKIFNLLGSEPIQIDDLIQRSTLPSHTVTGILTLLELQGLAKHMGGMTYIKK